MKPNFLFITADDLNYNSLGVTGSQVEEVSPHLDRLAADGIMFKNAHVNIAVCQPSRSVLMTGLYPHRNGALGFQEISRDVPTLTEQLAKANYWNGIIGKENHLAPKEKFCWDAYISVYNQENVWGRSPEVYYRETLAFLMESKRQGKPFFLMANSHDPHRPLAGSEQELKNFGYRLPASRFYEPEEVEVPGFLPDIPDVRREVAQYYSSVHRLDDTVGQILQALRDSGLEENTMVMFLSDNGMAFPFAKTNCYLNGTKTPWMCRWPGKVKPGSVESGRFISGIDFMPTILEAAGLEPVEGLDGKSFLKLLLGEEEPGEDRSDVYTMFNKTSRGVDFPMRCVQNGNYGYIYNAWSDQTTLFKNESMQGLTYNAMKEAAATDSYLEERIKLFDYRVKEELYDFENDPDSLVNLINSAEHAAVKEQLRSRLLNYMESTGDPITALFRSEITGGSHGKQI